MPDTQARKKSERQIKVVFILLSVIFFVILFGYSVAYNDSQNSQKRDDNILLATQKLVKENAQRIKDIQESRTASCKQTYQGIREVFMPFFPPSPRTAEQQERIEAFTATIERFVKNCDKQTEPTPGKG